jgi:hypothetical protein
MNAVDSAPQIVWLTLRTDGSNRRRRYRLQTGSAPSPHSRCWPFAGCNIRCRSATTLDFGGQILRHIDTYTFHSVKMLQAASAVLKVFSPSKPNKGAQRHAGQRRSGCNRRGTQPDHTHLYPSSPFHAAENVLNSSQAGGFSAVRITSLSFCATARRRTHALPSPDLLPAGQNSSRCVHLFQQHTI